MIKNRNIETIHNRNILALLVYGTKTEYIYPQVEKQGSRLESWLGSLWAAKIILLLQKNELGKSKISKELGHKQVSGALNKQIKKEN